MFEQGGYSSFSVHAFDEKFCPILINSICGYIKRVPAFAAQQFAGLRRIFERCFSYADYSNFLFQQFSQVFAKAWLPGPAEIDKSVNENAGERFRHMSQEFGYTW